MNKTKKINKTTTLKIVLTGMFTALSAIANSYLVIRIGVDFRITFNLAVYFFAGIMLGAPLGFAVGVIGDFLGWLLFVDGTYNPIIALSSGLFCFIPGLFYWLYKRDDRVNNRGVAFIIFAIISYLICFVVCTMLLNSLGIWLYYTSGTTPFFVYMVGRSLGQLPVTAVNFAVCIILYYSLKKIKYFKEIL